MKKLIVTLDRGNSSAKLALWDETGTIVRHLRSADCSCARACTDLVRRAAEDGELVGAAFASVVKDGGDEAVERALREAVVAGAPVVRLEAASRMPMSIAYSTPGTLGADRIAAALGAMALAGEGRPLLVIDLGNRSTMPLRRFLSSRRKARQNLSAALRRRPSAQGWCAASEPKSTVSRLLRRRSSGTSVL